MAVSVTSICNKALSRLGANFIIDIDSETTEAQLCKANYDLTRDVVLEEHQWTFAIRRYELPKVAGTDVTNQYANKYLLPTEVINVIRAGSEKDDRRPNPDNFRVENGHIVSDAEKMYVKAVIRITDPQQYSPMFIQALAIRLASELAWPVVQNTNLAQGLLQEYARLLELAAQKDGQQGTTERIRSGRYVAVRASGHTQ